MKKKNIIAALTLTMLLSGCATIVGDKTQTITVASTPNEASILITDENGAQIFKGNTPTNVTLKKSNGHYWGKKSYSLKIAKKGYNTQIIPITASANGWYIAGNLVFGGFIGWFVVDPFNGAMYTLSPDDVKSTLDAKSASTFTADNGGLNIVLVKDVPHVLRSKMKRLD